MMRARAYGFATAGALTMLSIAGCGPLDLQDETVTDEGAEIERLEGHFVASQTSFKSRIQEFPAGNTFRICLYGTDVTEANRASKQTIIRDAAMVWVDAVRTAATSPLITGANITFNAPDPASGKCAGPWDLEVNWVGQNGRAMASPQVDTGVAWMLVYNNDGAPTVVHEFGHVFGLGDAYLEEGGCQPGQPNSVMCRLGGTVLHPDDVLGIQTVFRSAFPGMITMPAAFAWAGSEVIQ